MDVMTYLGYKIIHISPEESYRPTEDVINQFLIFKSGKRIAELKFILPMPNSFAFGLSTDELMERELNKVKEIIVHGFNNNSHREFELTNTGFDEIIELN